MPTKLGSIIRQSIRKDADKLNIATFLAHERYQLGMMAKTGHNFYFLDYPTSLKPNETYEKIPDNCHFIKTIPTDLDFDLILCPAKRYAIDCRKISLSFFLPILNLEVFVPDINRSPDIIKGIHHKSRGDVNVFIDDYCRRVWQWPKEDKTYEIIPHGIDTDIFCEGEGYLNRNGKVLTIANDFIKRDWSHGYSIWKDVTQGLQTDIIGNTPGLSKAVELEELVDRMGSASVYLNTTLEVPVPTSMMEAMACGCPVVALDTGGIGEIIKSGYNGYLCNNVKDLKQLLLKLLKNEEYRCNFGYNARKTILDKYSLEKFVENWDRVLRKTASMPYTGDLHANQLYT